MVGGATRAPRAAWSAVLALLALVLGMLATVSTGATAARADDGDLVVELTGVSPAVLTLGDTLTVTGRIVNTTEASMDIPSVRLRLQKHVPASTEALASWLDGTSELNVAALTGWQAQQSTIPAGGAVTFSLEIETEGTFSQYLAWGPRGIEIEATSGGLTASARTTLLWYPSDDVLDAPAELTMLVPLTPTAREWSRAVAQQIPVGEAAAPRLLAVLDAVGPDASLAVDPVLLEEVVPGEVPELGTPADADPETPTTTSEPTGTDASDEPTDPSTDDPSTTTPASQADLLARLSQHDSRRDVIALGYADADLAALSLHDGGSVLWSDGVSRGRSLFDAAGIAVEDVAWPAETVSAEGLALLADAGAEAVVLDADRVAVTEAVASRASATTSAGTFDVLLADTDLGTALVTESTDGVSATQAVLALSAVMTRALPQDPGGFLVTLPRDVGESGLGELSQRIDALRAAPWLQPANLRSLLGRTDASGVTVQLPDPSEVDGGVTGAEIDSLLDQRAVVDSYTQAAGPSVREGYLPLLLAPLSAAFTDTTQGRAAMLESTTAAVDELASSIHVEAGSSVLLISGEGAMPVTITNDLPVEATVYVQLVPEESRVQVSEIPVHTLPANSSETLRIPITAVANGDVTIDVRVLPTPTGRDLAAPASFAVRVRAEWENIGTAVVAGLLLVAFVVGLIRTIRRGGRRGAAQR